VRRSGLRRCLLAAAGPLLALGTGAAREQEASAQTASSQTAGWPVTEGLPGGGRYSPLADIYTGNVDQLEQAWVYRTGEGDFFDGSFPVCRGTSSETTPILVDGLLILTLPSARTP
jgi:quinoprotein glucose dehydrogenase